MCSDHSSRWAAALSLTMLLSACTVKEDRQSCPCFLTLDFSGIETSALEAQGLENLEVLISGDGGFADHQMMRLDERVHEYCVPVPRSGVYVMAVSKDRGYCSPDEGLVIEEGDECPVIQMFSSSFASVRDEDRLAVLLHKNYCGISVHIKTSYGIQERPFKITVDGNINGYSPDGTPKEGPFRYFSGPSSEGLCRARVPRQTDDSLWLEVDFLDSSEIRTFPIGKYILESGYDWTAEDLEDISVEMDFSRTGIELSMSKWQKTLSFEITF